VIAHSQGGKKIGENYIGEYLNLIEMKIYGNGESVIMKDLTIYKC
jgi:hypothetical protein